MRKVMVGLLMFVCAASLTAAGCAKKQMVKGEAAPVPSAQPAQPKEQPAAKPPVKEETVQEQPVKEAPSTAAEEGGNETPAPELNRIHFEFDSYLLSQTARDILSKDAQWMLNNKGSKVQIQGHCDERGSDEYNLALGEKRAKAAMNYLITLGVPADRLSVISYGKEKPLDPGHNEIAWAKNRRDDFVIIK